MRALIFSGKVSALSVLVCDSRAAHAHSAQGFMQGQNKPDYLAIGFAQIDRDLALLIEAFAERTRDGLEWHSNNAVI